MKINDETDLIYSGKRMFSDVLEGILARAFGRVGADV